MYVYIDSVCINSVYIYIYIYIYIYDSIIMRLITIDHRKICIYKIVLLCDS